MWQEVTDITASIKLCYSLHYTATYLQADSGLCNVRWRIKKGEISVGEKMCACPNFPDAYPTDQRFQKA